MLSIFSHQLLAEQTEAKLAGGRKPAKKNPSRFGLVHFRVARKKKCPNERSQISTTFNSCKFSSLPQQLVSLNPVFFALSPFPQSRQHGRLLAGHHDGALHDRGLVLPLDDAQLLRHLSVHPQL